MSQLETKSIADDAVEDEKLLLRNNHALRARNAANTANIDLIFLDAFNRTTLNGPPGSNIIFNNSFIPSTPDTFSMGVLGDGLLDVYTNTMQFSSNGATYGELNFTSTTPSGVSSAVVFKTSGISRNLAIFTDNGTATKDLLFESGNASAGDSGSFKFKAGTATGVQGYFSIDAAYLLMPRFAADPTGTFIGGEMYFNTSINKAKVFGAAAWETITSV